MNLIWLIPLCVGAYLVGNVNFSIILARFKHGKDIRKMGSGNAGATNMLRQFGTRWGIVILLLDVTKGVAGALTGYLLYGRGTVDGHIAMYAMGLAVVLGHCFPVIYKFRGGKGVSTIVGVFLVANPLLAAGMFLIGFLYVVIWEYGAVSSIIFVTVLVINQSIEQGDSLTVNLLLASFYVLVIITHRKNIFRILTGGENRASVLKRLKKKTFEKKRAKWLEEDNCNEKIN